MLAGAVAGGVAQGVLGFGGSFVALPVLALLLPWAVPSSMLLALLPLLVVVAWRDRASVDRPAFVTISLGRVPGIVLGALVVAWASTELLTIVVAACLLAAVAVIAAGVHVRPTATTRAVVGAISGFTGTAVALGGPPLALLYHDAGAADRRGTLNAVFSVGTGLAVVLLALAGQIEARHLPVAALIALGLQVGGALAPRINRRLDDDVLRRLVLGWAAVGALVAAARTVLG